MSDSTTGESAEANAVGADPSEGSYTLFIADFGDVDTAWTAFDAVKAVDGGRQDEVEGVLVVIRGDNGKLEVHRVHDSGMSGMTWGLAGGALGLAALAFLKISLIERSLSPTYMDTISAPLTARKFNPASAARALTSMVFEQPGGP